MSVDDREVGHVSGTRFVGRTGEIAALDSLLGEAAAGRGRLVLIGGEPGIGKSRLSDELAQRAEARGFRTVWGRCWEGGGAPAYWPWVQTIRSVLRGEDSARVESLLGPGASDIAQMVPEVREALPGIAEPPAMDPDSARFRLFDATAAFLRRAAGATPVVVILDDLQSADAASLLLLRFVARELSDANVLLAATYRTTELLPDHPLTEAVSDLHRIPSAHRLTLSGLAEADVGAVIEGISGAPPAPAVVGAIHHETEGNPLFVGEVVRLLVAEGRLDSAGGPGSLAIPQGVREVIGRRLLRLSDACTGVLTLAAVLGRDFELEPLRRLSEHSADELLEVLDEAETARLVVDLPGALGWRRFSHALIRETLYEDLSVTQRLRLHRTAGTVLEAVYAAELDAHLPELAHHFAQAAPAGEAHKAVEYARRAADQALARLAYEEAVRLFGIALQALESAPPVDDVERCELLVALAEAQAKGGDLAGAQPVYLRAADLARRLGLAEQLSRAALGYGGRLIWSRRAKDPHIVPLLEDALEALGPADSELRVRVMARLACALRSDPDPGPRERIGREAVEIARRLGDPGTLSYALDGLAGALWGPDAIEERRALHTEGLREAERGRDRERELAAKLGGTMLALEIGDLAHVRAAIQGSRLITTQVQQPAYVWFEVSISAVLAMAEGRFEEAAELGQQAKRQGERSTLWNAGAVYAMHRAMLYAEIGGLDALEHELWEALEEYGGEYPMYRGVLARYLAARGRTAEAETVLAPIATNDFADMPRDNEWIFTLCLLAETAVLLQDPSRIEALYEQLAPYAAWTAFGPAEGLLGSVESFLGLLAGAAGRLDDALEHLDRGEAENARMGFHAHIARTRFWRARVLRARDAAGDRERADAQLAAAASVAERLGMRTLLDEISSFTGGAAPEVRPAAAAATLRPEGEYWSVAFGDAAFRLKDSKGLGYLARLVAESGREFHALDLVTETAGGGPAARPDDGLSVDAGGGTGPALDATAKAAYRSRLADLEATIDEAEAAGDSERAARARDERDAIAVELAGAVGLGGRDRPTASAAERARLNVTRALRSAVARIGEHSPELGTHLDRSVRTGIFCAYEPDPQSRVEWRL